MLSSISGHLSTDCPQHQLLPEHACCLNAKANDSTCPSGARGTEPTGTSLSPRGSLPQPGLPGREKARPPRRHEPGPSLRGNPGARRRGPGGADRPAACWSRAGPGERATTHLSRRSRREQPTAARSRPGRSHARLRRLHLCSCLHFNPPPALLQRRAMMTQPAPGVTSAARSQPLPGGPGLGLGARAHRPGLCAARGLVHWG